MRLSSRADAIHELRKLRGTLRMVFILALARTFGRYEVSYHVDDNLNYAVYRWRGDRWAFPVGPLKKERELG